MKSLSGGIGRYSRWSRQGRVWLAALALGALGACGGGTSQIEPFKPTRIIAFGDEASVLTPEGKKYSVNGLNATTGALDCSVNPIWVQKMASFFGLVFPQCNPDPLNTTAPTGIMYATAGAKVADVKTKIDQHFSTNTFGNKDLVAIMVGTNDILEVYAQYPALSEQALLDELKARGTALADQVNRVATAGGRVIVSTLPDVGLTPFALKERAAKPDTDRAALLTRMTLQFNVAMRLKLINDGRMIGLILVDESMQQATKYPSYYGIVNVTDAVCLSTVALQDCTPNTLVTGGSADTWLWASDTLLSPVGQGRIGDLAITRAHNNPF
ncbi:SGNH/GDSL hydrolase family protein [Roseateles violae]|uniref:SGNH/GDSL hydrolase family protein n=1 Tax=Roseateles violae TaxID=3058042 RepID=A0ABT8DT69_9BURK|nr:SGNH/GDSL hydrolase family protein [Pelomonas sp. PFR6]MDN3921382.1 SGNH/GDSL hydrolase family protein [Pelomonas sp. PFR6]